MRRAVQASGGSLHTWRTGARAVTSAHERRRTCSAEPSGAAHMFPQRRRGRCRRRCSRRCFSVHSLPRVQVRRAHPLPRRQPCGRDGMKPPPRSSARPEPQAVVRSTLPDAATMVAAREPTEVPARPRTVVRMPVNGEARGAWTARRSDARCRRSRQGVDVRDRQRTQTNGEKCGIAQRVVR